MSHTQIDTAAPVTTGTGPNDAAAAKAGEGVQIQAEGKLIQTATPPAAQRPADVPEKFWDAKTGTVNTAALLKSYSALEQAQSGKTTETPAPGAETKTETPPPADQSQLSPIQKLQQLGTADIQKDGKLSDATYAEAAKQGFDKATVDAYVAGIQAQETAYNGAIAKAANGPEQYNKMIQWAAANANDADIKAYNAAVTSGDTAKAVAAVQSMNAKYTAAVGKDPARTVDGSTTSVNRDTYTRDSYMKDMASPEYKTSAEFRQKVYDKLARTEAAGINVFTA